MTWSASLGMKRMLLFLAIFIPFRIVYTLINNDSLRYPYLAVLLIITNFLDKAFMARENKKDVQKQGINKYFDFNSAIKPMVKDTPGILLVVVAFYAVFANNWILAIGAILVAILIFGIDVEFSRKKRIEDK